MCERRRVQRPRRVKPVPHRPVADSDLTLAHGATTERLGHSPSGGVAQPVKQGPGPEEVNQQLSSRTKRSRGGRREGPGLIDGIKRGEARDNQVEGGHVHARQARNVALGEAHGHPLRRRTPPCSLKHAGRDVDTNDFGASPRTRQTVGTGPAARVEHPHPRAKTRHVGVLPTRTIRLDKESVVGPRSRVVGIADGTHLSVHE